MLTSNEQQLYQHQELAESFCRDFQCCGNRDHKPIVAFWTAGFFSHEAGVGEFQLRFADRTGHIERGHGGLLERDTSMVAGGAWGGKRFS